MHFFQKSVELDPKNQETWKLPIFETYDALIKKDSNDVVAWVNKGNMYAYKKEIENAVKCYEKAFEIDPNDALARYNLGVALERSKDYEGFVFARYSK